MATATLQDDPNVKIPAAVRAQTERTDALIRSLSGADPQPDPNALPADGQPSLTADPQPDPNAPPADGQTPAPASDDSSWEHKYNSMHGRYMAMKARVDNLTSEIANLQNVLAAMQTAPAPAPEQPASERLITSEEETEYGADLLDVVGRKAREQMDPIIKQQAREIADLKRQLGGVTGHVAQNTQAQLLDALDAKLPQWREINTNDDFIAWLALPDVFSGAIRHQMLKEAYAAGNATRVLAFFNGFLSEEAATNPAGENKPDPNTQRVAKIPLESLAAPGKAKATAANPAPVEKPLISRAQIASFYADVAAGKYRGRDTEKLSLEKQIFSAQAEGRITN